nr:epithelial discoidin domain-containing receptor 1-like [Cherax quadricarinatus]
MELVKLIYGTLAKIYPSMFFKVVCITVQNSEQAHALSCITSIDNIPVTVQSNKCDAALGLADGTIPDSSFTSSVSNSTPEEARLDGNGSWCFLMPLDPRKEVTITIDLGENRLVSGVQTQGPPLSLYNKTYYYHIGFKLLSSTNADAEEWVTCCDRDMQFLASDSLTQANVITTHPLPSLLLVRHLRFRFITDIRSIGNSTKCLRLEVLGCPRGGISFQALARFSPPSDYGERSKTAGIEFPFPK